MRYKISFAAGFVGGYLLGARGGRTHYDSIMRMIRNLRDNPSVQEAAGVVQAQAVNALDSARRSVLASVTSRIGGAPPSGYAPEPFPAATGGNGARVNGTGRPH